VRVLVVGSGGREHALAWKLAQSPSVDAVHAAPGNPGIAQLGQCHPIRAEDGDSLLELARTIGADLVVVGPEAPLVAGVADQLRRGGVAVFGPSAAAAQIEGSKSFAKDVMRAAGVPIAETMSVARVPCVVKADGLAAGKGVFMCHTQAELDVALRAVATLGDQFVIEELLEGEELSVFAIVDGRNVLALPGRATTAAWATATLALRRHESTRPCPSWTTVAWPSSWTRFTGRSSRHWPSATRRSSAASTRG
jgi:phosphoribosylamine--glycine ligase